MSLQLEKILDFLKKFKVSAYNPETEEQLEESIFTSLKEILRSEKILIKAQSKNQKMRTLIPDITIGLNQILIEIKYLKGNLNDIYRLYYQAVKYTKIAKDYLVFFIYDPGNLLSYEDKEDLAQLNEKVKIIHKH
jgi:hypothetical protein